MLNRLSIGAIADRPQHRFALVAVCAGDAYLDQLVALEIDFDLAQHRFGQPFVPDQHDRVQRVGTGFERLASERCELHLIHREASNPGF
jgi:hypothetical protein